MFKIINIEKDCYIKNDLPLYNSGKAEQGVLYSSSYNDESELRQEPVLESRYLCKIDLDKIISTMSGSLADNDIYLRYRLSDLRKVGNDYKIMAYPLSSSFEEGLGKNFNSTLGATWKYSKSNVEWSSSGGDYLSGFSYSASINEETREMILPLNDYIEDYQSGSFANNGLLFKVENQELYRLSFYSKDDYSGNEPKVFINYDDHVFVTGSYNSGAAHQFTGSYLKNAFDFISYNHDITVLEGENLQCQVDIDFKYRRRGLNYEDYNYYVEDVNYSIYDETRSKWFLSENDKNKLDIDVDSMYLSLDTTNFPAGAYTTHCSHNSGSYTVKSKINRFVVVDE